MKRKLYVISSSNELVKIGVSICPQTRLIDLQCTTENKLELAWSSEVLEHASGIEKLAHRLIGNFKVRGEWFACSVEHAITICKEAISSFEPKGKKNFRIVSLSFTEEDGEKLNKLHAHFAQKEGKKLSTTEIARRAINCALETLGA